LTFLILSVFFNLNAQDKVLLTIDDEKITKAEFERIYKKNNSGQSVENKSIEEYLDLFINFKLKVFEAEKRGLDTTQAFIKELSGYKKQLAKPYFVDEKVEESLLKEAYERLKTDVHAAHILVKVAPDALAADTLAAWQKIEKAKKEIESGKSFEEVAKKYSEDPSSESGGDLGYFTAFRMVYDFENVAYNTKPGQVSNIFRSQFGYHIIKVIETRPSMGEVKVAHIMLSVPQNATKEEEQKVIDKINEIYQELQKGADFAQMAKEYSIDKQSSTKGGELPWFKSGNMGMVPEFETASFALQKPGDISKPVRTKYFWHIIKLLEKKDIGTYEQLKTDIKSRISKDARAQKSKAAVIERLKNEYKIKEDLKTVADFYKVVDKSVFAGEWKAEAAAKLNKVMFSLGDTSLTQSQFAKFIESKQGRKEQEIKDFVDERYKQFVDNTVTKYEEDRLEKKYDDFRFLMKEYHDGILLFELTDQMVWSKAVKDSVGLAAFYEKNKNNYMWDERADATVYYCKDAETKKAVQELLKKKAKKGYTNEDIMKMINGEGDITNENKKLRIENGIYLKGENRAVDHFAWNLFPEDEISKAIKREYIYEGKMIKPSVKTLDEAKGLVTADYQEFLEKEWIAQLRAKYKISVDKEVLKTVE